MFAILEDLLLKTLIIIIKNSKNRSLPLEYETSREFRESDCQSIPASYDTLESEGRQMKWNCWKNNKKYPF